MGEWTNFFENTKEAKPSAQLIEAINHVASHGGKALDLGCGAGRDSRLLAEKGYFVTSVDNSPDAEPYVNQISDTVNFVHSSISKFKFGKYDLINSMFVLSFMPPSDFEAVMPKLVDSLNPGGILNVNIFGVNDEWNTKGTKKTFLDKKQVERYLEDLDIIQFSEIEKMGETGAGQEKYWHVFNIIVRNGEVVS